MLEERPRIAADEVPFGCEAEYASTHEVVPVEVPRYDLIPDGLDAMAPGPVLAGWLSSVDVSVISPFDRIVVLRAHDRLVSHFQALRLRDMVAVADAEAEVWGVDAGTDLEVGEAAAAEIRAGLCLTRRRADVEMGFALDLDRRLPDLYAMLVAGEIDISRARVIETGTLHLSDACARKVLEQVAGDAGSLTTGQLRARIRRLCVEADPEDAAERYDTAVEGRKVVAEATVSGTTNLLGLDLPPDRASAISNKIDTIARGLRGSGEARSMDQLRADVYLDLLDGVDQSDTSGASGRGTVDISVDLETLAGLSDHPGELGGYGPVIADVARRVTRDRVDARWRVSVVDDHGEPVAVGVTRRRPTSTQRDHIEVRDRTCAFPGCRMPARRSDIDHIEAFTDAGATSDENLAPLCRRDHCIKHAFGWTYQRLAGGRYEWTSPFGHTYIANRAPP